MEEYSDNKGCIVLVMFNNHKKVVIDSVVVNIKSRGTNFWCMHKEDLISSTKYLQSQVWHPQLGMSWNLHLAQRILDQSHCICHQRILVGSSIDQMRNKMYWTSQPGHSCRLYNQDFQKSNHSIHPEQRIGDNSFKWWFFCQMIKLWKTQCG